MRCNICGAVTPYDPCLECEEIIETSSAIIPFENDFITWDGEDWVPANDNDEEFMDD